METYRGMFDEGTLLLVDVIQLKIFIWILNITTRLTFFNKNIFK